MLPVLCRRAFLREMRQALAVAQRHNHQSFLVYVDIDGLHVEVLGVERRRINKVRVSKVTRSELTEDAALRGGAIG